MKTKFIVAPKAIILNQDKVLILKRSELDDDGGTWEFTGGSIDHNESPIDALRREVYEETGISDLVIEHLLYAVKTNRDIIIIEYVCSSNTTKITLSEEHSDYAWVAKSDLNKYLPSNIMQDLIDHHFFK
ncbi:MAG: NUDIX hydrolase [Erysipelotrichaceae bacterium]